MTDLACEKAWNKDPNIRLIDCCRIFNDTYAALAPHPGAKK